MGILDELKKLARPADDYYDDFDDFAPPAQEPAPVDSPPSRDRDMDGGNGRPRRAAAAPRESGARNSGGYFTPDANRDSGKVVNIHATTQLQVILVKPERFENAAEIADHLREKRTVVLNLEQTNKDMARRLIDFLSGVAYAQDGKIKKVAISTYIITPYNVDLLGDLIDELENNGLYF